MSFGANIFDSEVKDLGSENYLHFINIELFDDDLVELIDERIVSICEGCTATDLGTIKKRLIAFLNPKKGSTTEMGAIAEFFTHLYLNEVGFKQDFLFLNLEEGFNAKEMLNVESAGKLVKLRDALLPKLISGELRVEDC